MNNFNKSFFTPNTEATIEQAEARLIELGYKNFSYKTISRSNGVSFYFTSEHGEEIRVSDHRLTGNRAFNTIQIDLYEIKVLESKKTKVRSDLSFIERMISKREAKLNNNN